MRERTIAGLLVMTAVLLGCANGEAETVRLTATRDVWVSAFPEELDTSMGKTSQLKLKGNQELALLDFDTSQLRGKKIVSAELWVHDVAEAAESEKQRIGVDPARPDCLRKIGVSTVGNEWVEGAQERSYQRDDEGHGATYREASYQQRAWAYPGSQLWAVIFGNGNSRHCHGEREYQGDGWWKVAVDPRIVAAMRSGLSEGMAVEEETSPSGEVMINNYVHSRESGEFAPYLVVSTALAKMPALGRPKDLKIVPAPAEAGLTYGAARITFTAPRGAFGYVMKVNGARVPAWRVPFAAEGGAKQSILFEDLPARAELTVEVQAVGETGLVGPAVVAKGEASAALAAPPLLPASPFAYGAGEPPANKWMRVWAFPEVTKVDPVTTEAMFEPLWGGVAGPASPAATPAAAGGPGVAYPNGVAEPPQKDLTRENAVWDGKSNRVRLVAARGEIVAFQIAVEVKDRPLKDVRVELTDLKGPSVAIGRDSVRTFRMWYVQADGKWHEEYAVPLIHTFDLPAADNAVPNQKLQAVYVDIAVPQDLALGVYSGTVLVTAAGSPAPLRLGLDIAVYPVSIPEEMTFNAELNCYNPPGGEVGSDYFYAAHRLAHYHRCTLNTVPYSQTGRIPEGYAPAIAGKGADVHITDWSAFDKVIGPLLDGSAFLGNPRRGVPVKTFYLPLCEHWPLPFRDYYPFQGDPRQQSDTVRHMFAAPPIEQAFPAAYREGFINVAREVAQHLQAKGWTRTDYQAYLNDKPNFGGTWWTLDEPSGRDDWQALRFWAGLVKQGAAGAKGLHLFFRGDVSRSWWQYDQLDGLMDTIYYNGEIFDLPRFAKEYNRRIPDPHVYGAANEVSHSDHETAAWCLKAAALGLNGVLPWDSLGEADSLREASQTTLIVPGNLAGYAGPVASLRVFALRRGAQDVELLKLLAAKRGWRPEQVGALVAQRVPLQVGFTQKFTDEAAALGFGELSAQGFAELKAGVLQLLTEQ